LTDTTEQIAAGDLGQRAEVTTHDEIGTLASTFNQMTAQLEETVGTLEQRVATRTRRLEIVAFLGERLSAILDFDQLLLELVNQVKERFGYYHAHVYIIDDNRRNLVMTAGVGQAGVKMKEAGHAIPLNALTSLVARAARTGEVVTVDNVREVKDWLPNPLLPDTYSEMAVPVVLNEQAVGVLDVQEDKIAGLDESDAALLRSLANQVAVAIRNARLFEEVETALAEARVAQEKYIEQTWDKTRIRQHGAEHLHLRTATTSPLPEATMAEAKELALVQDGPAIVIINGDESDPKSRQEHASEIQNPKSIVAPVTLSGQTIGVLQTHQPETTDDDPEAQAWTDEDLALVEAVLDQVAQTAESLRLFEDTRERASREQTIREITDKLRAAPNLERLVTIATEELGQRLLATHAKLELGLETSNNVFDS
jgi:GAF domain-containing protein